MPITRGHARRAGIIAAGRGERLQQGEARLKPLVQVGGASLIQRVLASIGETCPDEVAIIVNESSVAVKDHVESSAWPFARRWIVETTPSSMHSFLRVLEALSADGHDGPFVVSTVDTIAPTGAYRRFAAEAEAMQADIVLAVTRDIDDDNPLLVDVREGWVTRVRLTTSAKATVVRRSVTRRRKPDATYEADATYCTTGYYSVRARVAAEADMARRDGLGALRQLLARLVARGYRVGTVEVPPGIDVDRPDDVVAAEAFVKQVHA